jgi:tRNA (guanosine-2'-O-)-methyltransferase
MVDLDLLTYLESFYSPERKSRFIEVLEHRTKYITVATEDVYQLHNTSAVIRSCEVFGVQDLHMIEDKFGNRLDKNIAMGAQQWVDVHSYENSSACVQKLRDQGYEIIATTPYGDACSLEDFNFDQKLALFFGTEKDGLGQYVLNEADRRLKVPMSGFTESLNVSVSAAIILQHLTRQLRMSDLPWQLTDKEKMERRLDWSKKSIKGINEILKRYDSKV